MNPPFQQTIDTLKPRQLELDDSGAAVLTLQRILQQLAFYNSPADGYFGPDTAGAIRQLQQHFGLAETGKFDTATWYALTFWAEPLASIQPPSGGQSIWQLPLLRSFSNS